MSKPVFTHEDMMREIAARNDLRLMTVAEDIAQQRAAAAPAETPAPAKPRRPVYKFH